MGARLKATLSLEERHDASGQIPRDIVARMNKADFEHMLLLLEVDAVRNADAWRTKRLAKEFRKMSETLKTERIRPSASASA